MEQPKVYNKEEELIKWLKYDLKEQRIEIAYREEMFSGKKIPLKKVEERYLTLNIGMKIEDISDDYIEYIKINFEFNLHDIIYKLFDKLSYEGINCNIHCNRLIFNKKADFSNNLFYNKVNFIDSRFMGNADFSSSSFNNEVNFSCTTFNNETDFSNASFYKKVNFFMTTFNSDNSEVNFYKTLFEDEVDFSHSKFIKFKNKACFSEASFKNEIKFSWAIFNNEIDFSGTLFKEAHFDFSKFYNKVDFSGALFDKVYFSDSGFYNKDNVYNKLNFSNITINSYLRLDSINIQNNTEIIFSNIKFIDKKSHLSVVNIKKEVNTLCIKNTTIDGRINIENVKVETVDFKGSVINGGLVNPVNFEVDKFANRESALFLKNEAYARNNIIDALKYKAKEIEKHKEDLLENSKDYKDWVDIISIELSSLYSDNGLNWIKSFLYTILFPILFFTMSYNISCIPIFIIAFISLLYVLLYNKNISKRIFISAITYIIISIVFSFIYFEGYNNIDYVIKEFFSFIAPTNFSQILYEKGGASYIYNSKNILEIIFASLFYFLGKIAFWYGSVQTVQSFRKFSKKE